MEDNNSNQQYNNVFTTEAQKKLDELVAKEEIDLSKVDWNVLTPVQFQEIEARLIATGKLVKSQKKKEKRKTGTKTVMIKGKTYEIKASIYDRLVKMKSGKSKDSLIDEILVTHVPISDL